MRLVLSAMFTVGLMPASALAHVGHIGDLAGHSHWVGVAALAGAAVIAVVAAKLKKRSDSAANSADAEADGAETPVEEAA